MSSTDQHEQPLHPAASVLRDHLLLHVDKENEQLRKSIGFLEKCRDLFGSVDLRLRSGHVVHASLDSPTIIVKCPHPRLYVPGDKSDPSIPLSECWGASVSVAGQDLCGKSNLHRLIQQNVPDKIHSICRDKFGVMRLGLILLRGGPCVVEGDVIGLQDQDEIDLLLSKNGEEQRLHLEQSSVDITFAPRMINFDMTDELREVTRAFGAIATYDTIDDVTNGDPLPVDPNDSIEGPPLSDSDESRNAMVTALGCTNYQVKLLNENQSLKVEQFRLKKTEEMLRVVEIGPIKLSLTDGFQRQMFSGHLGLHWRYASSYRGVRNAVALNGLRSMKISVSGIRNDITSVAPPDEYGFVYIYLCNGGFLMGEPNEEARGIDAEDFRNGICPPESKIYILYISLPLDSVRNALDVLGVDVEEPASDTG